MRVSRSAWWGGRNLRCETSLSFQKKLACGCNLLREEIENIGAAEFASRITNLNAVEPGLYELVFDYSGAGEFAELESATLIPYVKGASDEQQVPVDVNKPKE